MMKTVAKIALIMGLIVVGYYGYGVLMLSGATRSFENTLVDQCKRVDVAPGTEDIQYDPDTGLIFITADDRRAIPHGEPIEADLALIERNGIYALDVSPASLENIANPVKVSPPGLQDFRPHGLSLWSDGNGTKRLFVVNHPTTGKEIIEIFDVGDGGMLTHLESVSFPEMFSPNDVLGVGPRQFYATNDLKYGSGFMLYAEVLLTLPYASAVYFDGKAGRTVATGLEFGNGINYSSDQSTLYIAEWTGQKISIFERLPNNDLKKKKSIALKTAVDNLDVDAQGNIWFAGQPRMFEFIDHVEDPKTNVTSVAFEVDPDSGSYEQVFVSTKGELNASSVAAVAGNKLVIGAVFDGHVLVCPKPD